MKSISSQIDINQLSSIINSINEKNKAINSFSINQEGNYVYKEKTLTNFFETVKKNL